MSLKALPKVMILEGRIDRPSLVDVQYVEPIFAVLHTPDRSTKVPHMHLVVRTTLSFKKVRKAVREAYGLTNKMELMFREFDETQIKKMVEYYIDHDDAQVLVAEGDFPTLVTEARSNIEIKSAIKKGTIPDSQRVTQADMDAARADRERYMHLHREEWDIEPMDGYATKAYRGVMDRVEYMTKHWASQRPDWEFMVYCEHVLKYVTWSGHDHDLPMYRSVYSEFRFRGDVKLLFARYFGITPSLLRRLFGHDY